MAVRTIIEQTEGVYFITFTCQNRLSLFDITNSYDTVYKWFDFLKAKGHFVRGYVIMPNHVHVLVEFSASIKNINTIVSNGKRLMAYEIVKRLQSHNNKAIFLKLEEAVVSSDKERGKVHQGDLLTVKK